jgi:uncharacterized protein (TIGR03000 family)
MEVESPQLAHLKGVTKPNTRALVIVNLPSDAKLYLDGQLTRGDANVRSFYSPELQAGVNYFYTLKVEVLRSGQMVSDTQRVYFQAGREVRVSFEHVGGALLPAATEQK